MTKYRALVGLTVPQDKHEEARIIKARDAGTPIPAEERKMSRFEPGEEIDYVPEISLDWLLKQGLIEPVEEEENDTVRKR